MSAPEVKIEEGLVRGFVGSDLDGNPILSFLGIPYGKPAPPVPVEPWSGVLDATKQGPCCYQMDHITGEIRGSDNGLNVNVFTRELPRPNSPPKAVMVWIHGGAFFEGSNATEVFGPEFLLTADIVLVVINYRLGFLGFLKAKDSSLGVHGNAGLKDQTLALKWVQRNIKYFNGDPGNVTIFGESAGAASVHYQLLSASTEGLFHKAILQSGSALNPWAQTRHCAIEFVKFMGKDVSTEKEALDYLHSVPVEDILAYQNKYVASHETRIGLIGPQVETPNGTEVISERPIDLLKSGKYQQVPLMIGYNSKEGLLAVNSDGMFHTPYQDEEKHNLDLFIPWFMDIPKGCSESKQICDKFANVYLNGENVHDKYLLPSDFYFIAGIIASAMQHAKSSKNPVYLYRMDLDTDINFSKVSENIREYPGMSHADDLGYIFNITCNPDMKIGEVEEKAMRRVVELWTNFAKYGNPTPEGNKLNVQWKPIEGDHLHYLDITNDELISDKNPQLERVNAWREIFNVSSHTVGYM
ncbi:unnamed protein product [Phaedon cochleariae]|uniref:Carboxylesterase type B domain-containing protein n=1 Tax=Phaedon cochleariae TaxID=80249 RepID=A0A9N9SC83_PHACE|nr:unnamed protein product [Phaedon cochleariae]